MQKFSYIDGNEGVVAASDRGLAYGDGLFETMVAIDGRIRWLDYHLERLMLGCQRLAIPEPPRETLVNELLARVWPDGQCIVKLVLTRGSGPRGYSPPMDPTPVIIISVAKATHLGDGLTETSAQVLDFRLSENEKLAGIKHLCRVEQVLARLELAEREAAEGVLLSRSGLVVGCTSANLFLIAEGRVLTPAVRTAGISGVMRRVVLEHCERIGMQTVEVNIEASALARADELFLTNAVVGIRSISSLDGRRTASNAVARQLSEAIFGRSHGDGP